MFTGTKLSEMSFPGAGFVAIVGCPADARLVANNENALGQSGDFRTLAFDSSITMAPAAPPST